MTVGEFIDLCLIKITGGEINNENSVWRVDIKFYVPAAVHETLLINHGNTLKIDGDREVPGGFLAEYADLTVTWTNGQASITLPKAPANLASNGGIRMITDDYGQYSPMQEAMFAQWKSYYSKIFSDERFYRLIGRTNVKLYTSNLLLDKVSVLMIQDVGTLDYTDELPLAAGLEGRAIDRCVDFFTGQRQVQANLRSDGRDIN